MATMKDVAHLAGVSTATVSRALTNPEKVSAATHVKVEQAMQDSGYSPNSLARNLRRNESKTIVAIVPDICDPYFAEIIHGIEETANEHGYTVFIGDGGKYQPNGTISNLMFTKHVDGMLLLGTKLPFNVSKQEQKNLPPLVMACEYAPELELPTIHVDNLTAAFEAVNYLTSVGHKQIAQIIGDPNSALTKFRVQGYQQALRRVGIMLNPNYTVAGESSFKAGASAITHLLSLPTPPTAVFCHSDVVAIGAMRQAKRLGFRVPKDLSIMGFDDIQLAKICEPMLTTISQPKYEIGKQAMLELLSALKGNDIKSGSRLLEAKLAIRESVAPPSR